jgi:uncharacterized protein
MNLDKIVSKYSKFLTNNPYIVLMVILVLSLSAFYFFGQVGTKSMDNKGMLPDDISVIKSFNIIEDNFGGSDSVKIVVELDTKYSNSNEYRDIRNPEVIDYIYKLTRLAQRTDDVMSADSISTHIYDVNNGMLPKSEKDIKKIIEHNPNIKNLVNKDYSLTYINIRLLDTYTEKGITDDITRTIELLERPIGLKVLPAGDIIAGPSVEAEISKDMGRTSQFSMIGITIVLLLLFMSIRYALIPLFVIIFGILWAFGFFGLIGINMSSATSGAMSMIMGIGIDFGIQTISRYRKELVNFKPREAMEVAINNVFMPMFTTTLAALIGFKAMSMGQLTFLAELAQIMSYGILFCFLAAITVVPVISILSEEFIISIKQKLFKKN